MIGSVNLYNVNQPIKKAENNGYSRPIQPQQAVSFGYRGESQGIFSSIKDSFLMLTGDALGLVGFNVGLAWLQNLVSGKLLVGKINKHFTDNITPEEQAKLPSLAKEMLEQHGLKDKVEINYKGGKGEAFYTHTGDPERKIRANSILVGKDTHSSLFHEIGHAVEENNTTIFKKLQRGRGRYAYISMLLYAMLSGRKQQNDGSYSIGSALSKADVAIPLIAFAPELITEAKASLTGLKFLKEKKIAGKISESLYKNTRHSYLACFGTYLFVPLSIIIMDALSSGANRARERYNARQNGYYY